MASDESNAGTQRTRTVECHVCEAKIDMDDQWWQYQWKENPSTSDVEDAIEQSDYRDWITRNYVLCPNCHKHVQETMLERQGAR